MNMSILFLGAIVNSILKRAANALWDAVWLKIFEAVGLAEQKWIESGQGKLKRDWVVDQVLAFVEEAVKQAGGSINIFERLIMRLFAGAVADAIIGYVNETIGKDWRNKVEDLERELAERLPVIE